MSHLLYSDYDFESNTFDTELAIADSNFMEALTEYAESFDKNHYVTENEKDSIITTIKKFYANIIATIKNFISSIQVEVSKKTRERATDSKLHKMYDNLKKAKENGANKVKVVDVWTLEREYIKATDELKKLALKFSKMKYDRISDLDRDIAKFNSLYDKYDKELDELSKQTIVVDIDKMIDFVSDEISNRSKIFDTINDSITLMEQMEKDSELIAQREDILGPDVIPKHLSFLRKMGTKIAAFMKKNTVKFIANVVFAFTI